MAAGVQKAWSVTAASNASSDANINFAEGQSPASLNNSDRAAMAAVKGFAHQILGAKTSGGSANAQTFTSDSVAAISTAYAAGMGFVFKAGYTNSGACTFNVDGVGAKSIKKGGAQAALAANDIVAGGIYAVYYEASGDCFIILNPETGQVALDATLTALAALSWSSATPVIQFTAADTVSLTSSPTLTGVIIGDGSAGTPAIRFGSDTDSGFYYASTEMVWGFGGVARLYTNGSRFRFALPIYGNGSTDAANPAFSPSESDPDNGSYYIGTNNWGLAAGGSKIVDIATTGVEITGALRGRIPLSSETGTPTSASANKKQALAGNPTINSGTADDFILFDPGTSARTFTRGAGMTMYVNGTDSASATLAANQMGVAHYRSSTVVVLAGAFT